MLAQQVKCHREHAAAAAVRPLLRHRRLCARSVRCYVGVRKRVLRAEFWVRHLLRHQAKALLQIPLLAGAQLRQYLYFCTSKASKLSTYG